MTPLSRQDGGPDKGSLYCVVNGAMAAEAQHGVNHILGTTGIMHGVGRQSFIHCLASTHVTDAIPIL